MKSLRTLLKLAQRDLENLRRLMAGQVTRQIAIEHCILGHEHTIKAEQRHAMRDYESQRAYGGYAAAAVVTRKALKSEFDIVGAEIERLRDLINEAHVEVRKFERLIELEEERARTKRAKAENEELDEFATMRAARIRSS